MVRISRSLGRLFLLWEISAFSTVTHHSVCLFEPAVVAVAAVAAAVVAAAVAVVLLLDR